MKNDIFVLGDLRIAIIPVTPFQQNCLLLWNDQTRVAAVLDPGGDAERIMDVVRKQDVSVEKIVLTHGHLDHVGGVVDLRDQLLAGKSESITIEGPSVEDGFLLDGLPEEGRMFGLDHLKPFTPDLWLKDGDKVEFAGHIFLTRHCPGHTPGHVVFLQNDLKLALVGDVLFRQSVGRTDFPYGNHDDLIAS